MPRYFISEAATAPIPPTADVAAGDDPQSRH
jgi:hypothetical protein